MRSRDLGGLILLGALLALLAWGVGTMFRLRFVAGDVYPPYSSLRADPLGARALYEGLDRLPGVRAGRQLQPLARLRDGRDTTLFLLGLDAADLSSAEAGEMEALEQFVRSGGRVVLAMAPLVAGRWHTGSPTRATSPSSTNPPAGAAQTNQVPTTGSGGGRRPRPRPTSAVARESVDLAARWAFTWQAGAAGSNAVRAIRTEAAQDRKGLPDSIHWRGGSSLGALSDAWVALYELTNGGGVAVMERGLGRGTVVLCADAYLLSNEALRHHREPAWLAWVAGDRERIWFDESHLGITERAGVATLGRRYRLHGLLVGLLVVAALWLWRQALPLVPAHAGTNGDGENEIRGRDTAAGLISLLRRHVEPGAILSACYAEWRRSCAPRHGVLATRADRMQAVVVREEAMPPRERDPVAAYGELVTILDPPRKGRQVRGTEAREGTWEMADRRWQIGDGREARRVDGVGDVRRADG